MSKLMRYLVIATQLPWGACYAAEDLEPGDRYRIVNTIHLRGVYEDLNDRRLTKEKARAYLNAERYYRRSWVAFEAEVPTGTIMTIVHRDPVPWFMPWIADRYFVRLEPDLARGLDVLLTLDRGLEGTLNGLNPRLFAHMPQERKE